MDLEVAKARRVFSTARLEVATTVDLADLAEVVGRIMVVAEVVGTMEEIVVSVVPTMIVTEEVVTVTALLPTRIMGMDPHSLFWSRVLVVRPTPGMSGLASMETT